MSDIVSKLSEIKNQAAKFEKLELELKELKNLRNKRFIKIEQKSIIEERINQIKDELGIKKYSIEYSLEDIRNAKPKEMLIDKLLARASLTVFYGDFGSGKTALMKHIYKALLKNENVYIRYIDFDNPTESLKEFKIDDLQEKYGERFKYYGKRDPEAELNMVDEAEDVILKTIEDQVKYPNRIYILFEDNLKNIARKNKKGFLDTQHLWKLEKRLQAAGGTTIPLHHTNKDGVFADSQDIMNFADISFRVSFNTNSDSIIVEPHKQSRFRVEPKAFKVDPETREITGETEYKIANIDQDEIKIINTIKDLLFECGDFNQSELEKEIKALRTNLGVGERKFRAILKKHIDTAWAAKRGENNALIFSSIEKKAKEDVKVSNLSNQVNIDCSNTFIEDTKTAKVAKPQNKKETVIKEKKVLSDNSEKSLFQKNMNKDEKMVQGG
ncbi:MAG: hypothetical protein PHQ70_08415 [Arcobacter sp.]|jgi:hypothetical protein|uniref:hypothetical protein n=1 Tax=Arcobacter sp. TaxID=1872629 RepID=UPI002589D3FD|nr:hypothetical protein [Arcobacter sp.]MDD3008875.1 hypothetical protein [Arcobacter sp.]